MASLFSPSLEARLAEGRSTGHGKEYSARLSYISQEHAMIRKPSR